MRFLTLFTLVSLSFQAPTPGGKNDGGTPAKAGDFQMAKAADFKAANVEELLDMFKFTDSKLFPYVKTPSPAADQSRSAAAAGRALPEPPFKFTMDPLDGGAARPASALNSLFSPLQADAGRKRPTAARASMAWEDESPAKASQIVVHPNPVPLNQEARVRTLVLPPLQGPAESRTLPATPMTGKRLTLLVDPNPVPPPHLALTPHPSQQKFQKTNALMRSPIRRLDPLPQGYNPLERPRFLLDPLPRQAVKDTAEANNLAMVVRKVESVMRPL